MTSQLLQGAYDLDHIFALLEEAPRPVPRFLVGAVEALAPAWPVLGTSSLLLGTIWVMLGTAGLLPENAQVIMTLLSFVTFQPASTTHNDGSTML